MFWKFCLWRQKKYFQINGYHTRNKNKIKYKFLRINKNSRGIITNICLGFRIRRLNRRYRTRSSRRRFWGLHKQGSSAGTTGVPARSTGNTRHTQDCIHTKHNFKRDTRPCDHIRLLEATTNVPNEGFSDLFNAPCCYLVRWNVCWITVICFYFWYFLLLFIYKNNNKRSTGFLFELFCFPIFCK